MSGLAQGGGRGLGDERSQVAVASPPSSFQLGLLDPHLSPTSSCSGLPVPSPGEQDFEGHTTGPAGGGGTGRRGRARLLPGQSLYRVPQVHQLGPRCPAGWPEAGPAARDRDLLYHGGEGRAEGAGVGHREGLEPGLRLCALLGGFPEAPGVSEWTEHPRQAAGQA